MRIAAVLITAAALVATALSGCTAAPPAEAGPEVHTTTVPYGPLLLPPAMGIMLAYLHPAAG